jgi:hypothetical protein
MSARRATAFGVVVVAAALLLAGCGLPGRGGDSSSDSEPAKEAPTAGDSDEVESALVLQGREVGAERAEAAPEAKPGRVTKTATRVAVDPVVEEEWPAPELLADGSIDDGEDPFLDESVPVLPMPIEDDPYTTSSIEVEARRLRRIDRDQWDAWMDADLTSPWQQSVSGTAQHLVEVSVERCGGARHVATGVVLADETVVTNVHVVENAAKRVRVAAASGGETSRRYPAMIRYLDIDDDVAVLKVPGLQMEPMLWHQVVDPDQAMFGYAYGISRSGRAGTLRRVPVISTMREETIRVEQPDGFAEQISDRPVHAMVGGISSGMSGGVVAATNDPDLTYNWGFHGLLRARMGLRADTAGIVVPARIVGDALDANDRLEEWQEIRPGGCPQWHR